MSGELYAEVVYNGVYSQGLRYAGLACLLYDHALTFDAEVNLVWKAPGNVGKWLFLFIRYFTPLMFILYYVSQFYLAIYVCTSDQCQLIYPVSEMILAVIPPAAADFLLLLRINAIWNRRLLLLIPSIILYIISWVGFIVPATIFEFTTDIPFAVNLSLDTLNALWSGSRASILLFDVWAFALTLLKGIEHAKKGQLRSSLLYIFYRDGLLYYFAIIGLKIFGVIATAPRYSELLGNSTVLIPMTAGFSVAFTTRLFLNLRDVRTAQEWAVCTTLRRTPRDSTREFNPTETVQSPESTIAIGWGLNPPQSPKVTYV